MPLQMSVSSYMPRDSIYHVAHATMLNASGQQFQYNKQEYMQIDIYRIFHGKAGITRDIWPRLRYNQEA